METYRGRPRPRPRPRLKFVPYLLYMACALILKL